MTGKLPRKKVESFRSTLKLSSTQVNWLKGELPNNKKLRINFWSLVKTKGQSFVVKLTTSWQMNIFHSVEVILKANSPPALPKHNQFSVPIRTGAKGGKFFPIEGQCYFFHFRIFKNKEGKKIVFSKKQQKKKDFWIYSQRISLWIFTIIMAPLAQLGRQ